VLLQFCEHVPAPDRASSCTTRLKWKALRIAIAITLFLPACQEAPRFARSCRRCVLRCGARVAGEMMVAMSPVEEAIEWIRKVEEDLTHKIQIKPKSKEALGV
jgi:hypothetical protein